MFIDLLSHFLFALRIQYKIVNHHLKKMSSCIGTCSEESAELFNKFLEIIITFTCFLANLKLFREDQSFNYVSIVLFDTFIHDFLHSGCNFLFRKTS